MTFFEQRLSSREFESRIADILRTVEALEDPESEVTPTMAEVRTRTELILNMTISKLASTPVELISQDQITSLDSVLTQMTNEIGAYNSDKNFQHLVQVSTTHCDTLIGALQIWQVNRNDQDALAHLVKTITDSMANQQRIVDDAFDEIKAQQESFNSGLTAELENIKSLIESQRTSFASDTSTQEARITDLKATVDELRPRVDALLAQLEAAGNESMRKSADAFGQLLSDSKAAIDALGQDLEGRASSALDEIARRLKDAVDLVGAIGATGTAVTYGKEAEKQEAIANRWRTLTLAAGAIAAVLLTVFVLVNRHENLGLSTVHVIAGLAMLGVAGYCGQQAASHRRREESNRRTNLTLLAFPPFVEPLSDEDKIKMRKDLADAIFIDGQKVDIAEDTPVITSAQVGLFGQILNLVRKNKL